MDPQEITSIPSTSGSQDLPAGSAITRKRRKSFSEKVGDMTPMDNPVVSSVNTKELKIDSTKAEKPTLGREKSELKRKAWTSDLINYFFDALKMYGKDFDKITKYIRQKTKKAEYLKNYEQVRNLYYNTAKVYNCLNVIDTELW